MNKLTCGAHRTEGTHIGWFNDRETWLCRGCKLPHDWHETADETVKRINAMRMFAPGTTVVIADGHGHGYWDGMTATVVEIIEPTVMGNPGFEVVTMLDFVVELTIGYETKRMTFGPDELRVVVDGEPVHPSTHQLTR